MVTFGSREVRARQTARPPFPDRVTAQAESGGHDYTRTGAPVRSSKGALYSMQVMPDTARDPGYGVAPARGGTPDEYNRVGRDYRAAMFKRYGDAAKGWAAYNWGPGKLDALLARHGSSWFDHLPADVRDYVTANITALRGQ